jgi:hypothetical protein
MYMIASVTANVHPAHKYQHLECAYHIPKVHTHKHKCIHTVTPFYIEHASLIMSLAEASLETSFNVFMVAHTDWGKDISW